MSHHTCMKPLLFLATVCSACLLHGCVAPKTPAGTASGAYRCLVTERSADFITQMLSERTQESDGDELLSEFDDWAASQGLGGAAYLAARTTNPARKKRTTDDWDYALSLFGAFIPAYRANDADQWKSFFAEWTPKTKERCPRWRGSFFPTLRLTH